MTKKHEIQTHFNRLRVKVIPGIWSGLGEYNVEDLDPKAEYRVLATYMKVYDDRTNEPMFLIEGPEGNISARACKKFRVVELE